MWVPPVQLSFRQPVAVDHGWHLPAPSQAPLFSQWPAAASLATQRDLGSEPPGLTKAHVPGGLGAMPLQVLHKPPVAASLQAVSQQKPSVQKPLWHWLPAVQAAPLSLRPHEPATQVLGGVQSWASVATVQLLLHAPSWQAKPPHDWLAGVTQLPAPSQVEVGVSNEEVAQTAVLQRSPASYMAQAPSLQTPVMPQGKAALATHLPWGSGASSATAAHSPAVAMRLHAMQASVQALWQHTPCAQKPD